MYDTVFRRNRQGTSGCWNVIDPSLHTAYVAGLGMLHLIPCKFYNEVDYLAVNYALAPTATPTKAHHWSEEQATTGSRAGKCLRLDVSTIPGRTTHCTKVCISWNRG